MTLKRFATSSLTALALSAAFPGCSSDEAAPDSGSGGSAMANAGSGALPAAGGSSGAGSGGAGSGGTGSPAGGTSVAGTMGLGGASASGGSSGGEAAAGSSSAGTAGSGGSSSGGSGAGAGGSAALPAEITVWIAGDSTVASSSGNCPVGWGGKFEPLFQDGVTVVNNARGGRSVRSWLYHALKTKAPSGECDVELDSGGNPTLQNDWQQMLDGMSAGDYLLIQFGINDGSDCERYVSESAFIAEYGMMADAARERGAQPIFITPVNAIICDGSEVTLTRGRYAAATKTAATEHGVPVIDLHQLSADLYEELAFCPVAGGDVSGSTGGPVGAFFCADHTHFDDSGAETIAGLVAEALSAQSLGLATYLK